MLDTSIQVKTDKFDGPLALLLFLVQTSISLLITVLMEENFGKPTVPKPALR